MIKRQITIMVLIAFGTGFPVCLTNYAIHVRIVVYFQVICSHYAVIEAAVVGKDEDVKGSIPFAFIAVKQGHFAYYITIFLIQIPSLSEIIAKCT